MRVAALDTRSRVMLEADAPADGQGDAAALAARAQRSFATGATLALSARRTRLERLRRALRAHEGALLAALATDLGKPLHEAYSGELGLVHAELRHAQASLARWMKPRRVPLPAVLRPGRAERRPEPRGAVLIISPWNYPLHLALVPLVGALAAGCTVVLKPSEQAPATSAALAACLQDALPADEVIVVQGGPAVAEALTQQPWGCIFFVGSTAVGRRVMAAAAQHLTPVVLELGGKSPALVDDDVDLPTAARRIAWAKFHNAGQTCVAPDYVLVHQAVHDRFLQHLTAAISAFYGPDPRHSPDYARIVSRAHTQRLAALRAGGRVVCGGQVDLEQRYVAPTVLSDVDLQHALMREEIFGPLLPVIAVPDLESGVLLAGRWPTPLSAYIFTRNARRAEAALAHLRSGSAVVNDALVQLASERLPLGGLGPSGMGSFHGQATFEAFTHWRSVMKRSFVFDLPLRYPPYRLSLAWLRRLIG
jgi:aldehyde dehydrogenase (NAD+)